MKRFFLFLVFSLYALFEEVSYEESFSPAPFFSSPNGHIFESLYVAYQKTSLGQEYLIPKHIHFIWLGSPLPDLCRKCILTWKRHHPGWIVHIWTDEMIARFGLQNQIAFDLAKNWGEKSDIARYEILYRFGGIYADTDFECLKPLDDLHKSCEFYTGVCANNECLLNGLIGSRPGHPILKACIDHLKRGPGDHDEIRIMTDSGPYHFTRMFLDQASHLEGPIVALPPSFFYPFPAIERDRMSHPDEIKQRFAKPESFAIHYWASSWMHNKQ